MTVSEAHELIKQIDNSKYRKTAWEEAFMAKMRDYVKAGRRPSPEQGLSLQSIYRKSQGG